MKKLMIAAAVVCAAVASQAATFTWGTTAKAYMPSTIANIAVGTDVAAVTSGSTKQMSAWDTAGTDFTYVMLINGVESKGDVTFSSGKINVAADNGGFVKPTDDSSKNIAWDIVITGKYTDDKGVEWTMVSDHITGNKDYTKGSADQVQSAVPAKWTITKSEPVPEPTSAMLLVLGVAGLALKRKRA